MTRQEVVIIPGVAKDGEDDARRRRRRVHRRERWRARCQAAQASTHEASDLEPERDGALAGVQSRQFWQNEPKLLNKIKPGMNTEGHANATRSCCDRSLAFYLQTSRTLTRAAA